MICITIPANALMYGTFLNISPASFAIFNTVLTRSVVGDATYPPVVADRVAIRCAGGIIGSPWATIVIHEACNPTVCSGSISRQESLNVNRISTRNLYLSRGVKEQQSRGSSCACHDLQVTRLLIDARPTRFRNGPMWDSSTAWRFVPFDNIRERRRDGNYILFLVPGGRGSWLVWYVEYDAGLAHGIYRHISVTGGLRS